MIMKIQSQTNTNLYNNTKKNTTANYSEIDQTTMNSPVSKEETPSSSNNYDTLYNTVYNNATLNHSNNHSIENNELSDEELANKLDRRVYDTLSLADKGIEFGSKDFREWLKANNENTYIPYDAPPKIRQALYDMIDSIPEHASGSEWNTKVSVAEELWLKVHTFPPNDIESYKRLSNEIITKYSDNLSQLKTLNDPSFKASEKVFQTTIDAFSSLYDFLDNYTN